MLTKNYLNVLKCVEFSYFEFSCVEFFVPLFTGSFIRTGVPLKVSVSGRMVQCSTTNNVFLSYNFNFLNC